jgi:hypothetical protein
VEAILFSDNLSENLSFGREENFLDSSRLSTDKGDQSLRRFNDPNKSLEIISEVISEAWNFFCFSENEEWDLNLSILYNHYSRVFRVYLFCLVCLCLMSLDLCG